MGQVIAQTGTGNNTFNRSSSALPRILGVFTGQRAKCRNAGFVHLVSPNELSSSQEDKASLQLDNWTPTSTAFMQDHPVTDTEPLPHRQGNSSSSVYGRHGSWPTTRARFLALASRSPKADRVWIGHLKIDYGAEITGRKLDFCDLATGEDLCAALDKDDLPPIQGIASGANGPPPQLVLGDDTRPTKAMPRTQTPA
ncbi:hypothetical protein BDW66DRAFT_150318 [Aspergillus desertorum]